MLDLTWRSDKSDTTKRREKAEKYLQKGKVSAALEEYHAILQAEPENDSVRQAIAEIYLSQNADDKAAKYLGELFQRLVAAGESGKAVHNYKKLIKVAAPTGDQAFSYAQLIEGSNPKEALQAYEKALAGFGAIQNKTRAMAALDRMVALDPSEQNFWRAGELALELGDSKAAAVYFFRMGEMEDRNGGNSAAWYERAHKADPANTEVTIAHARAQLQQQNASETLLALQPLISEHGNFNSEARDLYARSLIAAGRLVDAQRILWELFLENPKRRSQIIQLIDSLLTTDDRAAVALARKLEQHERRRGNHRDFLAPMKELAEKHASSPAIYEYLVELFNTANRESDYAETLLKLFDLYVSKANYIKAGDCLDRAAEVDPYEPGHQKRLEILQCNIDYSRFKAISERFTVFKKASDQQHVRHEEVQEPAMLQDLMLQAEILVQYGMRSKAQERLQRIEEMFPGEEEHNEDLRRLYMSVGMTPRFTPAPPAKAAAATASAAGTTAVASAAVAPVAAPAPPRSANSQQNDVEAASLARVTEITRKLYQEGNVKSVLNAAALSIGTQWNATRCMACLRTPGKPASLAVEYCASGVSDSDLPSRVAVLCALHDLAIQRGQVVIPDSGSTSDLASVQADVARIGGGALLALPLADSQEQVGLLVLQYIGSNPEWRPNDLMVLRSLTDQIVLALHNARLRRLVRNLSVTDEKSGLLKRSSYFDVLLSEVRRAQGQSSPTTVMLMHFGKPSALVKEVGHDAVETMMKQIGQIISSHLRQADFAIMYDMTTIAILLADTAEKGALLAIEKLNKVLADIRLPGRDTVPPMTTGIAEAVMRPQFDPTDIVTEVINRVEGALDQALGSTKRVCALPCAFITSAA